MRISGTLLACAALAACAPPPAPPAPGGPPTYADGRRISWETLVQRLSEAQVVFVGEQHDDPVAHRLERRLVEDLGAARPVVVGMEMFERDVQAALDRYLDGTSAEEAMLAATRPWRNYASDYRPVVELARARRWPVLASNVPRRIASAVARSGLDTLGRLAPEERALAAAQLDCPEDEYFRRFTAEMGEHPGMTPELVRRMYAAQCVKDETMAEAVAAAVPAQGVVVHLNGAFHSDQRMGIVPRLLRRRPDLRVAVVSLVRAAGPTRGAPAPGDFVVYTGPADAP